MAAISTLSIFTGAFLLFLIQPMAAKMLLPYYGGAAAVWNACMVFFQIVLLMGYGYSHLLTKRLGLRFQVPLHLMILLLPLWVLPITLDDSAAPPADADPVFWLLRALLLKVGLPFFVISSISPLLQRWFSLSKHPYAEDPYFLYSASNAGSFLALLGYPFLFERLWNTAELSRIWSFAYVALVLFVISCLLAMWYQRPDKSQAKAEAHHEEPAPITTVALKPALFWVFAAFVPSALMLAVTNHITTNIAPVPLLWVLPLSLYLLSFVVVFARKLIVPQELVRRVLPFLLLPLAPSLFATSVFDLILLPFHLLLFFAVALACHGELALARPPKERLTEYYFLMSLGGALGGFFVAIAAPKLFDTIIEYPIALFLTSLVVTRFSIDREKTKKRFWDLLWPADLLVILALFVCASKFYGINNGTLMQIGLVFIPCALMVLSFRKKAWRFAAAYGVLIISIGLTTGDGKYHLVYQGRNFFGQKKVIDSENRSTRSLVHGNTTHGLQHLNPALQREPLAYFHRSGPIGDIFKSLSATANNLNVSVVGLGAGTIASYIGAGSKVTFIEIDPDIKELADDKGYFSFLYNMEGHYDIAVGDGRLELNKAAAAAYDLIILDAFSSDSVPVHLLTQEAVAMYKSKMKADGILVFNISNRYLDLKPVLASHVKELEMIGLIKYDKKAAEDEKIGKYASDYAVLAMKPSEVADALLKIRGWELLEPDPNSLAWTDQYSNILSLLKFKDFKLWQ